MKDYDFKIKIADILKQSGTKDTLHLKKKFSTNIPQLDENGISCEIEIIGLDNKTLLVNIKKCVAGLNTSCDNCGKQIDHLIELENLSVKVFVGDNPELVDDDVLIIDQAGGVINLEEYITNTLLLEDSVTHRCNECNIHNNVDDELEEGGTVTWKYSTNN